MARLPGWLLLLGTLLPAGFLYGVHLPFLLPWGLATALGLLAGLCLGPCRGEGLFWWLMPLLPATVSWWAPAYPFNYLPLSVFLLQGLLLGQALRQPQSLSVLWRESWLRPLLLLYGLMFLSGLAVLWRWSLLGLGGSVSWWGDTPVNGVLDRTSFAILFPVLSWLLNLSPLLVLLLRRQGGEPAEARSALPPGLLPGMGLSVLLALLQRLTPLRWGTGSAWVEGLGQVNGGFSDFNGLGLASGILLFLGGLLLWGPRPDGERRWRGWAALALGLAGISLSGSRTALLWVLALLWLLWKRLKDMPRVRILGVLGLLLLFGLVGGRARDRFLQMWRPGADGGRMPLAERLDRMTNGRVVMARQVGRMLADAPLGGVGLGNYLPDLRHRNRGTNHLEDLPLNQFLLVGAETGIPGLLVLCFWVGGVVFRRRSPLPREGWGLPLLVTLMVGTPVWLPEGALLLGLLLSRLPRERDGSRPSAPGRRRAAWGLAVLLGGLLLTGSLRHARPRELCREAGQPFAYGFWDHEGAPGAGLRWTQAEAGVWLEADQRPDRVVKLFCGAPLERLPGRVQTVSLFWKGACLVTHRFTANGSLDVRVPSGEGLLELRVYPVFRPASVGLGGDGRKLGVQVRDGLFPEAGSTP